MIKEISEVGIVSNILLFLRLPEAYQASESHMLPNYPQQLNTVTWVNITLIRVTVRGYIVFSTVLKD
jgi:hypothetical protein